MLFRSDADEAADELRGAGLSCVVLPALESVGGEAGVSAELFAERLAAVRSVASLRGPCVVVAPIAALMQLVPRPSQIESLARTLKVGQDVKLQELLQWLTTAGYRRVETVEEVGDFALRGGILDVFPPGSSSRATKDLSEIGRAHV